MAEDQSGRQPIPITWLIAARDQLESALGQAEIFVDLSLADQQARLQAEIRKLDDLLRRTFAARPDVESIVVLERLGGYSVHNDRHVLRIEVQRRSVDNEAGHRPGDTTEARMVKVGSCQKLCQELLGRTTCQRPGDPRGRTLLEVEMGVCPLGFTAPPASCPAPPREALGTIVYQDAYHTLRAARVVSLEKAFLNCVRWGTPSPQSLLGVLDQVYQELQDHCYQRAPAIRSAGSRRSILAALAKRLRIGSKKWGQVASIPGERRIQAREMLGKDLFPFVDLLDFHARAFQQPDYQPEFRYGAAHGDLHGRNVVVGLIDGEAYWPAVFDFEDMDVNNFLAWDFVKMETELKIRALRLALPCPPAAFADKVWEFEMRLDLKTESRDRRPFEAWHDEVLNGPDDPAWRLLTLLLGLRRRAKRYLQVLGPPRTYRWLHEYYFFLACYGIYAGRFENYTGEECLATYVGASCAATRYTWGAEHVHLSKADGQARGQQRVDSARWLAAVAAGVSPAVSPAASVAASPASRSQFGADPRLRWDVRLEEMRVLARSRDKGLLSEAIAGLRELKGRIPAAAAEIASELAFALLEMASLTQSWECYCQAMEELTTFEERQKGFYSHDVELLCRWGRLYKDCGDGALKARPSSLARGVVADSSPGERREPFPFTPYDCYRISAAYYRRAYEASRGYYPGVNLATLSFLLAVLEPDSTVETAADPAADYARLAAEIREDLLAAAAGQAAEPPGNAAAVPCAQSADALWRLASLGEVCLLLGEAAARDYYCQALERARTVADGGAHAVDAIRKQAQRIMAHQQLLKMSETLRDLHARLAELFK